MIMKKRNDIYKPLDCGLYDHLEAWATRGVNLCVVTRDGGCFEARLNDLQTIGKEEFAYFEGKEAIRLDRIESVNGIPFFEACSYV